MSITFYKPDETHVQAMAKRRRNVDATKSHGKGHKYRNGWLEPLV
jgi:hypothetical protein